MKINAKLLLLVALMVGTVSVVAQKTTKLPTTQPPTNPPVTGNTCQVLHCVALSRCQFNSTGVSSDWWAGRWAGRWLSGLVSIASKFCCASLDGKHSEWRRGLEAGQGIHGKRIRSDWTCKRWIGAALAA